MKLIGITQRVEIMENYGERRDCNDQEWNNLLLNCELLPIWIPNNISVARHIITTLNVEGVILTGGNDLAKYGGNVPERDEVEKFCLEYAISNNKPVLGICRGFQFILDYYGTNLVMVSEHVGVNHKVEYLNRKVEVNSYHKYANINCNWPMIAEYVCEDGMIESARHFEKPIYGIMWHPERCKPFRDMDIDYIKKIFIGQIGESI